MKKNILNQSAADEIATRIGKLQSATGALWGKMNAAQMLRHCNDVHTSILDGVATQHKPSSLKQTVTRFLLLNVLAQIPKGRVAPAKFAQKGEAPDFEKELQRFHAVAARFPVHNKAITLSHPFLGKLNTRQWGRFVWMHYDHHLRQFGV